MSGPGHAEHDLFTYLLDRAGQIHVSLGEFRLRFPWGGTEELVEGLTRHREAGQVVEVLLVEAERAILSQVNQLSVNEVDVPGHAIWRKAHDLVLSRVDSKSSVVGECRVEEP